MSILRNQSGARLALDALLLLAFPLLFTFAKFVAELAVSSHQFVRLTVDNHCWSYLFFWIFAFFLRPRSSFSSFTRSKPNCSTLSGVTLGIAHTQSCI